MNHANRETLTRLLEGSLSSTERLQTVTHVVDCDMCGDRFRALSDLHQQLAPRRRRTWLPLTAAIAMAAALFLIFTHRGEPVTPINHTPSAAENTPFQIEQPLLQRVQDVNFQAAIDSWGHQTSMTDLVILRNRS